MNNILNSTFRTYLILFFFVGFLINTTSCAEKTEAPAPKRAKSTALAKKKAANNKNNKISNSKNKQKKANQKAANSNTKGNYWSEVQSTLNLSNPQMKCLKAARKNLETQKKKLPKVGGKVNPSSALRKLTSEKNAKMKSCLGKKLFDELRKFNAERNK